MMTDKVRTELIDNYRKEHNLTVEQFCKECHISKNTYYKFIKSRLSELKAEALFKIAKTTKLRCDDLLGIKKK